MNAADGRGRHHQLHGLQPVLPVHDVDAAAAWLRDRLGFEIEFLIGSPARHGRVKLGDGSWGVPIYIHLSAADETPIQPCGELRLHVGHDLDSLHTMLVAEGVELLQPPTDQPWGLRECLLRGPDGHRLRLCAEVRT